MPIDIGEHRNEPRLQDRRGRRHECISGKDDLGSALDLQPFERHSQGRLAAAYTYRVSGALKGRELGLEAAHELPVAAIPIARGKHHVEELALPRPSLRPLRIGLQADGVAADKRQLRHARGARTQASQEPIRRCFRHLVAQRLDLLRAIQRRHQQHAAGSHDSQPLDP